MLKQIIFDWLFDIFCTILSFIELIFTIYSNFWFNIILYLSFKCNIYITPEYFMINNHKYDHNLQIKQTLNKNIHLCNDCKIEYTKKIVTNIIPCSIHKFKF